MSQETFSIPNISCGHCTSAIENELGEVDGITSVKGNIEGKNVTVEWSEPATREGILAKLKEINYPATE